MARTANRYLRQEKSEAEKKRVYQAGNYLRLSVDSDHTGSDSLENQRRLAKEYADEHSDVEIVGEYVDDGKSGTTFLRPAFDRMMQDLKKGDINCVIVKDLSRFGREYIEAGNYIEKVFPFLGVRFISIVDRYDSEDPNCGRELLMISLKNLMHEMYAKDISRKVGSVYRLKHQEQTFYRSSSIPYGYTMDDEKNNYCVDDAAAQIVREIFEKYHAGSSKYIISVWLYEHAVLTPKQYKETGRVYCREGDSLKQWPISTIHRILCNPVYIGNVLRHKTEQSIYAGKKSSPVPKSEQVLIIGNHKPIISEAVFADVQKMLKRTGEVYKGYRKDADRMKKDVAFESNIFQGKIFCGDCKGPMIRTVDYKMHCRQRIRIKIFKCGAHSNNINLCDTRGIEEQELCKLLYTVIRRHIAFIKGVQKLADQTIKDSFEEKIKQKQKEQNQIQNRKIMLEQQYLYRYTEYKSGKGLEQEFQTFRGDYLGQMKTLEERKNEIEQSVHVLKTTRSEVKKMFADWLKFGNVRKLTEEMVQTCIERIDIYAGNRIEIRLTYQDLFEQLETWKKERRIQR